MSSQGTDNLALRHSIQLEKLQRRIGELEERLKKVEEITNDVQKFCDMVDEEDKQYSKLRKEK